MVDYDLDPMLMSILKGSESENMTVTEVQTELADRFNVNITRKRVYNRLNSLVKYGFIDSNLMGNHLKVYSVRANS